MRKKKRNKYQKKLLIKKYIICFLIYKISYIYKIHLLLINRLNYFLFRK